MRKNNDNQPCGAQSPSAALCTHEFNASCPRPQVCRASKFIMCPVVQLRHHVWLRDVLSNDWLDTPRSIVKDGLRKVWGLTLCTRPDSRATDRRIRCWQRRCQSPQRLDLRILGRLPHMQWDLRCKAYLSWFFAGRDFVARCSFCNVNLRDRHLKRVAIVKQPVMTTKFLMLVLFSYWFPRRRCWKPSVFRISRRSRIFSFSYTSFIFEFPRFHYLDVRWASTAKSKKK